MPDAHTTFLPKTNGMVFADRLVARSDKGRVFGLGHSAVPLAVADGQGANWISTNVYEVGQTVEGKTAAFTGGTDPVEYRYRFQFKPTGSPDWVIPGWTNTTNAKNSVTYTITESGQIKLQSQARGADGNQLNSTTGVKTIIPPMELEVGATWVSEEPFLEAEVVTAHTATFINGVSITTRHRLQTRPTGGDGTITNGSWTTYDNTAQDVTYTLPATGVDVRFHCQGTDGTSINSFTGWRAVNAVTPPEP